VLPVDPPHEFADVQLQLTSTATVDRSGTYPPLTLGGYVDNYANEATAEQNAEALADLGVVMACFTAEQAPVLSALAREFAVCDQWFSSMPGPTWPNRFFLHAATSGGLDRSPTGVETVRSQFGGYQFENGSIYEALDRAGLDWRIYHGDPLPQVSALSVMDLDTMRRTTAGPTTCARTFRIRTSPPPTSSSSPTTACSNARSVTSCAATANTRTTT
jgi:phospholipase C